MTPVDSTGTEDTRINPVASWAIRRVDEISFRVEVKYVDLDPGKTTGLGRLFSMGLTPSLCRLLAHDLLEAAEGNLEVVYPRPS